MPVLVITDKGDVILKGDTIHERGYKSEAEGIAKGLTMAGVESKVVEIWYDNYNPKYCDLTDEHKDFLKAHGQEGFLKEVELAG